MNNNFVNRKDRIIASAIEIINETGLSSLNTRTLAMKENMSESLLYRYFGGIEEVLVEVIDSYTKFDKGMIATIEAKDISHFDKVVEFMKTLNTYYNGYKEMGAIVLQYEELLHNVNTREPIAHCITTRTEFMRRHLRMAMEEGEIRDDFSPEELSNIFLGSMTRDLLNRRIEHDSSSHPKYVNSMVERLEAMWRVDK